MTSADGGVAVVFNGEIYNFRELRDELAQRRLCVSHRRRHGSRDRGLACVGRGRGRRTCAACSRSRCGTRARRRCSPRATTSASSRCTTPGTATTLVFGSELKAVLAHPAVRAEIDLGALRLYLECQFIPAPHCVFRDVRKLHAGPCARAARTARSRCAPTGGRTTRDKLAMSEAEAVDALDRELRTSVEGMLVADVPLGRVRQRRRRLEPHRGGDDRPHARADRHFQHRLRRRRRGERASRGGARRCAPRQPPPRADAVARPRARRVRPLDRRVRRAVRRPGRAADDAARRVRAPRRHRRADGRGRRRGLRRLFELSQARARGAPHALARARSVAAARDREEAAGGVAQGSPAALADRAARAPLSDDPQRVRRAAASAASSRPRLPAPRRRARPTSARSRPRHSTRRRARRISIACCTSTRGCGCPTISSPRSIARR